MVYEIAVAILTLAVVVLIIYVIGTLRAMKIALEQTQQTLAQAKHDLVEVGKEVALVMRSTDGLIQDVHQKMRAFDRLIGSVSDAGDVVAQLTGSAKQVSATVSHMTHEFQSTIQHNQNRITEAIEVATSGVQLFRRLQGLWNSIFSKQNENKE